MLDSSQEELKDSDRDHVLNLEKEPKIKSNVRIQKEQYKNLWKQIKYLKEECNVPMYAIAKRLKLSSWSVRKIFKKGITESAYFIGRAPNGCSFKKIHMRARARIEHLLYSS